MKKLFTTNRTRKITLSLLFILIFAFFHSELGQFSVKGDNHESHSFSTLINGAIAQNFKIVKDDNFKLQINKEIHIQSERTLPSLIICSSLFLQCSKPPEAVTTYLKNQTFLI